MIRQKIKTLRSFSPQQHSLNTASVMKSPIQQSLAKNIQNRTSLIDIIQTANLLKVFKQSIEKFKGTNSPVTYKQEYDFSQKWQQTSKIRSQKNYNLLLSANIYCLIISLIVMIHKIPLIWYLSIKSIFDFSDNYTWFIAGIVAMIADWVLQIYLVVVQNLKNNDKTRQNKIEIFNQIWGLITGDIVTLIILILKIIFPKISYFVVFFDYIGVMIQLLRFSEIYSSIIIILITHKYKHFVNLIGFIGKMLIFVHFIAIFIYTLTFANPQNNWLEAISKNNQESIVRYVYSMYFISTTMFTIGYGDITPQNIMEISIIIFVQISGVILNGYIVSQIGHILSTIRRNKEQFQHDIQNTDQICEYYKLNQDLRHRVQNYIVNNRLVNDELNLNQENQFMMKLNEELRNEVKHANQLQIIKTSLFFLCNWSKKMQNELSKRLQKFTFSPNQRILSKDKLFIVTKGKIDIFIQRKAGNKVHLKKHLKTIERQPSKQIFSNAYGYVNLFTGKPSRLTAVSKDFTICYALNFGEMLEIMKDDQKDFQYYHETKTNLELEKTPEKLEVPTLINNRQHYCPTKKVILQKYKKSFLNVSRRSKTTRSQRKINKIAVVQRQFQFEESEIDSLSDNSSVEFNDQLNTKQHRNVIQNTNQPTFVSFRSYRRKYYIRITSENKLKQQQLKDLVENNIEITSYFQTSKCYQKYFKQGNKEVVLSKLNQRYKLMSGFSDNKCLTVKMSDAAILNNKALQLTQRFKTSAF